MIIGILDADQLKPDIQSQYGSYSDMFQRLLHAVDESCRFKSFQVTQGLYPRTTDECDAFIITGSKANAYDNTPWIVQLRNYITALHQQQRKLVGICFGHQVIAQALGGDVKKYHNGWGVGIMSSKVLATQTWMHPLKEHFSLLVSHQDQVIKLPDNAQRIASNDFCLNSSYQINRHILTFQGHPEFSADYLKHLMRGRQEIIGVQCYEQALNSLQKDADNHTIARWILNFLTPAPAT